MSFDLAQGVSVVVLLVLTMIPLSLSIVIVLLSIQTQRIVDEIRATKERKAAEEAVRRLAREAEAERAAMEQRLSRQIGEHNNG